jgi:transcriptional regulator GlxA family with amidase domain
MSKYHFIRVFKETTGVSPMKHLLSVRLSAAKALLRRTDLSVQEIAKEVGYENALTFSRVFKNSEDIAPSEYRKKLRSYAITE